MRDAIDLRFNGNIAFRMALALVGLGFVILSKSCSNLANQDQMTATDDALYLTPIPKETLEAFREGTPIESKLQAVIAARVYLGSTRLHFTGSPKVISVVEEEPNVWRVVFEGEWQVIPPDPRPVTLSPPVHGCVDVTIYTNDNGRTEIGTIGCIP
jgi:hypothetical protein